MSQFSEEALGGTKSAPWRETLGDGDVGDVRFCHGGTAGKYHLCDFRIVHYKQSIYIYIDRGTLIYEHLH